MGKIFEIKAWYPKGLEKVDNKFGLGLGPNVTKAQFDLFDTGNMGVDPGVGGQVVKEAVGHPRGSTAHWMTYPASSPKPYFASLFPSSGLGGFGPPLGHIA